MLIPLTIFFAIFIQTASGFGLALVSMPLLVGLLGIRTATPLVALIGATAEIMISSSSCWSCWACASYCDALFRECIPETSNFYAFFTPGCATMLVLEHLF